MGMAAFASFFGGTLSLVGLTLLAPQLMPDLLLWLAFLLPVVTLLHEHDHIDWRGLGWALTARAPGTVLGVAFVSWFSTRHLGIAVGVMVLASVLVTLHAVRLPVNPGTLLTAGFVSGVTGTTTSIGGPPLAILYQHRPALLIRSTLAVYFLAGAGFSLVGLGVTGGLEWSTLLLALAMVPCLVVGFAASRLLRRVVPARHTRSGVLLVCGLSAVVLLVRSLAG